MMARSRVSVFTVLAATSVLLAACAGEATAPVVPAAPSQQRTSPFVPTDAQKALIGVVDGAYSITFDPTRDQSFSLGPNHLDIPGKSVCKLGVSGYSEGYWNQSCTPESRPVTITAIVKDAATDHPRIDFFPAMRFNPTKNVALYIYVPTGTSAFAKSWTMQYCNDWNQCNDESTADGELRTFVDARNRMVFRRIKHFSGYVVAERDTDASLY